MVMGVMRQKVSPFKTDGAMTAVMMEATNTHGNHHCQQQCRQQSIKSCVCGSEQYHDANLTIHFCI